MRGRFVKAMANGQQSMFTVLQKEQMRKKVTVRFLRPLGEVVGFDLNRYGPFRVHDVAEIPAANAEVLISNGEAAIVYTKDSVLVSSGPACGKAPPSDSSMDECFYEYDLQVWLHFMQR